MTHYFSVKHYQFSVLQKAQACIHTCAHARTQKEEEEEEEEEELIIYACIGHTLLGD